MKPVCDTVPERSEVGAGAGRAGASRTRLLRKTPCRCRKPGVAQTGQSRSAFDPPDSLFPKPLVKCPSNFGIRAGIEGDPVRNAG